MHGAIATTAYEVDVSATRLWRWMASVDPAVRNTGTAAFALGVALAATGVLPGLLLCLAGPGFIRWAKPDALARERQRREFRAAMAELDRRLAAGDLDETTHLRRRMQLTETAPF